MMKNRLGRALISGLLCFSLAANPLLASDFSSAYGYEPGEIKYNDDATDYRGDFLDSYQPAGNLSVVSPPPELEVVKPARKKIVKTQEVTKDSKDSKGAFVQKIGVAVIPDSAAASGLPSPVTQRPSLSLKERIGKILTPEPSPEVGVRPAETVPQRNEPAPEIPEKAVRQKTTETQEIAFENSPVDLDKKDVLLPTATTGIKADTEVPRTPTVLKEVLPDVAEPENVKKIQPAATSGASYVPLRQRVESIIGRPLEKPLPTAPSVPQIVDEAQPVVSAVEPQVNELPAGEPQKQLQEEKVAPAAPVSPVSQIASVPPEVPPAFERPAYVPIKQRVEAIIGKQETPSEAVASPTEEPAAMAVEVAGSESPVEPEKVSQSAATEEPAIATVAKEPEMPAPEVIEDMTPVATGPISVSEQKGDAPLTLKQRIGKIVGRDLPETVVPPEYQRPKDVKHKSADDSVIEAASEQADSKPKVTMEAGSAPSSAPASVPVSASTTLEKSAGSSASGYEVRVESKSDSSKDLPQGIFGVNSFESGLRVESNSMLEGTPVESGQTLTLSYQITNLSNKERNLVEEFNMPPGFTLAFPAAEFTLAPMETFNSLIMITIPRAMPAGENKIEYNVFDRDDQSVRGSLSFSFAIKTVTTLQFFIDEQPENVIGNESFSIVGRIVNAGNASVSARLRVPTQDLVESKVLPDRVSLGAGQTAVVKIEVTPARGSKNQAIALRLHADNLGHGARELINQSIYINTRPLSTGRMDFKRRLPAYLTFYNFGNGEITGSQWQFNAKGILSADKKRSVDFLWRSVNGAKNYSAYSQREQFSLTYQEKRNIFKLGEHSFNLSALTGSTGSAEGLFSIFNSGAPTTVGLMTYKSKYSMSPIEGHGFFIAQTLSDRTFLRLNHHVKTNPQLPGSSNESITSLEMRMVSEGNSTAQAEFGRSENGGNQGKKDNAYNVSLSTRLPRDIGILLSRTDVGAEYGAGLSGAVSNRTSLSIPINKDVSANYSYSTYEQKPSALSTPSSVSEESRSELVMRYRMNRNRDLSLNLTEQDRFDKLNASFSTLSRSISATINETVRRLRFGYSFDRTNILDRFSNVANWTTGHQVTASFRAGKVDVNAYGGMTISGSDLPVPGNDSNNLGFSVNWEIIKNLMFRFNYREIFYYGNANQSSGDLSLAYRFPDTSTLDFTFRNNTSWVAERGNTDYRLTYSRFIGVPVGDDFSLGGLRGMVFDALASDSTPLPNITLIIQNFAAITDMHGRFMFSNLKPGTYTLDLDRRSVSINKIGERELPVVIQIEGGKIFRCDIGLVEGARLRGQVAVKRSENQEQQDKTGTEVALVGAMPGQEFQRETVPNLVVELSAGDIIHRRVTDADGKYSFSGIQPGKWNYKLYEANLPEGYKIDNPQGTCELNASVDAEQNFTVSPRVRKIMIIDED